MRSYTAARGRSPIGLETFGLFPLSRVLDSLQNPKPGASVLAFMFRIQWLMKCSINTLSKLLHWSPTSYREQLWQAFCLWCTCKCRSHVLILLTITLTRSCRHEKAKEVCPVDLSSPSTIAVAILEAGKSPEEDLSEHDFLWYVIYVQWSYPTI